MADFYDFLCSQFTRVLTLHRGKTHGDEDVSPGLLNEFNRPEREGSSREI